MFVNPIGHGPFVDLRERLTFVYVQSLSLICTLILGLCRVRINLLTNKKKKCGENKYEPLFYFLGSIQKRQGKKVFLGSRVGERGKFSLFLVTCSEAQKSYF